MRGVVAGLLAGVVVLAGATFVRPSDVGRGLMKLGEFVVQRADARDREQAEIVAKHVQRELLHALGALAKDADR